MVNIVIAFFPIPQSDELLTSILARYVHAQGIKDDKVALDWLFGCRTVVPSPRLQGHINQLLTNVGHLWQVSQKEVLKRHTILPIFSSFIPSKRYVQLQNNLIDGSANTSSLRSGINASLLNWPKNYQICPLCWIDDQQKLGYSYWRRHFQCPGVTCCWHHSCYLIDSGIPLHSIHRHRFVGTEQVELGVRYTEAAEPKDILLARNISQLFNNSLKIQSWTNFYRYLAEYKNLMHGKRIDHYKISTTVSAYWGKQ